VLESKDSIAKLSDTAISELKQLSEATLHLARQALNTYEEQDELPLPEIDAMEEDVDRLVEEFSENHLTRMKTEQCDPKSGVIFTDMIIDLERVGDHAENIAFSIVPAQT